MTFLSGLYHLIHEILDLGLMLKKLPVRIRTLVNATAKGT